MIWGQVRHLPDVPAGTVLELAAGDWAYGRGLRPGATVTLIVTRLRDDLCHLTADEVWVEGHTPLCGSGDVDHQPCRELLVRVDALPAAVESTMAGRGTSSA